MELAPMEPNFMDTHAWTPQKRAVPGSVGFHHASPVPIRNQGPAFWEHDGDIDWPCDMAGAVASRQRAIEAGAMPMH